jgi:hypothetical protein
MGFAPVATREDGGGPDTSRRIALILDLKAAYRQLKGQRNWIFRTLTADCDEGLHHRLAV